MFGLFTPRCPIDLQHKVQIERQMTFLADRLGIDRLRKARVLEPTQLATTPTDLFEQLRVHLGVKIPVSWEAIEDLPALGALPAKDGRYLESNGAATVRVETRQLKHRDSLASDFIHELCRAILFGERHLTRDDDLAEPTVELLSVFLGTGVLTANNCFDFRQFSDGLMEGYEFQKRRHLAADAFGFALSLFCWRREESPKPWQHVLRLDARNAMIKGLKFLNRTDDSVFADRLHHVTSTGAIEDDLLGRSDSRRLNALLMLAETDSIDNQLVDALRTCLENPDPQFVVATLQVLESHPNLATSFDEDLEVLLTNERASISMHVLRVVAQRPPDSTRWLRFAESQLKGSPHLTVQLAAIEVLASDQSHAEGSISALVDFARLAVARDSAGLEEAIAALRKLTPDMSHIAEDLRGLITDESIALRLNTCLE